MTLGATGKDGDGDRHPKLGARVLVGAGASVLGNIRVGDRAKIGCGSVVLKPIPPDATVVGVPAKIVGGHAKPPAAAAPEGPAAAARARVLEEATFRGRHGAAPLIESSGPTAFSLEGSCDTMVCPWSHLDRNAGAGGPDAGPAPLTFGAFSEAVDHLGYDEYTQSALYSRLLWHPSARGAVGSREAQLRRNVQGTPRGCGTAPSTPEVDAAVAKLREMRVI